MAPHLTKGSTDILLTIDVGPKLPSPVPKLRNFAVNGHPILFDVPSNVTLTPSTDGWLVGFNSDEPLSRHVVPIGRLLNIKFMSIFRFKVWWTTHWTGARGRDLENETQLLILDKSLSGRPYVLFLPLIEGRFRSTLQPGDDDNLDLCVESGSSAIAASSFRSSLYIHTGDDPFTLIPSALKAVKSRLGGDFKLMEEKTPPAIIDKFGWCTWDAFYLRVNPAGILDGVRRLAAGGCPPGLVLIDDGWQSICHDGEDPDHEGMTLTTAGEQMPCRLTKFEENFKFKEYKSPKFGEGLGAFVKDLKESYPSIEHVYVWHALCGYWGGLRPKTVGLPEARLIRPRLSPGLEKTMEDLAVDKIVSNGVGLVEPTKARELYEGLHSHLEKAGIDGVKVDVIHILEMLCEEYGGRVELAKAYYKGLTESVRKHFKGNGVIASMEHCNDFMFLGTEAISLGRVGDDFWCTDPAGDPNGTFWLQGCHMVHCAYNSLWMSNFIHPDWDMFQSTHPCAHFHAASRAISGGPVYVSDSVGDHDFELLRRLALPDGTILRCESCALPTRDCLFEDPLHDGKTMLKIWNLNKCTGVLGAFNCQGGGWNREARKNQCASEYSHTITATAKPNDIEWNKSKTPIIPIRNTNDLFAIYSFRAKTLTLLKLEEEFEVTLDPFNYELYVVSRVNVMRKCNVRFAPIGLVNMLNTGGAIQSVVVEDLKVRVSVMGAGEMRVYSSERPKGCRIDGEEVGFVYEQEMVAVEVAWSGSSSKICAVEYWY